MNNTRVEFRLNLLLLLLLLLLYNRDRL